MKLRSTPTARSIRARALVCRISMVSAVMGLLLIATSGLAVGRKPTPGVLPPGATLRGWTYGDWAAAWWQWTLQFPIEQNPMTDPTGAFGNAGQKGPVWFLSGTFDGSAKRSITVPAGKRLFFPLFNVFCDYSCPEPGFQPAPGQTLEEFLTDSAEAMADMATELFAEVDGVPLQNLWDYRAHSDLKLFTKHPSLVALDPCITSGPQPAVAAGYWLMLAPLAKGQHTVRFGSTAAFGDYEVLTEATYYLTVE